MNVEARHVARSDFPFFLGGVCLWKPEFNHVKERLCQRDHVNETMSESHSCLRLCNLVSGRVYDLRACFTTRVKHTLSSIGGHTGPKWGVQLVGPQGVSQSGEGVGFWA